MTKKEEQFLQKKEKLNILLENDKTIGVVGRIKSWLETPSLIYPFSCTTYNVADTMMDAPNSIENSWLFTSFALRNGAGVALNLTELRGKGDDNGKGLVASGPTHFIKIYSAINDVIRRGGVYKNGAVVAYLDISHPDLLDFLNIPSSDIPWAKRALYVSDDPNDPSYLLTNPHLKEIIYAMRAGLVWLAKIQYDADGNRIYSNVCLEILIKHSATCILSHSNLGMCTIRNIRASFRNTMRFLCILHSITNAGQGNPYLPTKLDRQVGMGVFGLANLLARYKVKYSEFADCLEATLNELEKFNRIQHQIWRDLRSSYKTNTVALVRELYLGFQDAAKIARSNKMVRAFTVAPTATCSFRYTDLDGYTTTPEISPPICHPETKKTVRNSDTFGQVEYQYHPNVETAAEVGWNVYYKLAKNWQRLMNTTGLAHAISFNIWDQCPLDEEWLKDWLESPLKTTYYRMQVNQDFIDKTSIDVGIQADFSEDGFISSTDENNSSMESFLAMLTGTLESGEELLNSSEKLTAEACSIEAMKNGQFCSSCAE